MVSTSQVTTHACQLGERLVIGAAALLLLLTSIDSEAASNAVERVKSAGKLTVGTEAAVPPLEFIKDGKITGYGRDILDRIGSDLGVKIEQYDLPWQGVLPGLDAGKFDLVATSVTITPARASKYAFTMPIAEATPYIIKRKGDSSIRGLDDLVGKRVGVQIGNASSIVVDEIDKEWKTAGKQSFTTIKRYGTNPEAYLGLANGDVDAVVHTLSSLTYLIKQRPGIYELVTPVSKDKKYYAWVTRPDDADLRDRINTIVRRLEDSGELAALQDKWFGFRMELPKSEYLPAGAK
jgi:polar amino acid transport system substrate-binding protein